MLGSIFRLAILGVSVLALFALYPRIALSYVQSVTSTGKPIRWPKPVHLNVAGNPKNKSGLSEEAFFNATVKSLQRWQAGSEGEIKFDYWQGTDQKEFPTTSDMNGLSTISFASNSSKHAPISPTVLGLTQVWYRPETGEIVEFDIILNDENFIFTDDPDDTSGYGGASGESSRTADGKSHVYVQNVLTHEIGHALGLSHSGALQATMLFVESPEQAHLGCDDLIGIRSLYPGRSQIFNGSLSGRVENSTGSPVFGAHVLAISQSRGTVLAGTLSQKDGNFKFEGLEPGNYFLLAEPFFAGPQALPAFYSDIDFPSCAGRSLFKRSFLASADSRNLVPVEVSAQKEIRAPVHEIQCGTGSGAAVSSFPMETTIRSEGGFGIVDRFWDSSMYRVFRLIGISGRLEVHALAYSLYSPIQVFLTLRSSGGSQLTTEISEPVYSGDAGFMDRDASFTVEGLAAGDYWLEVRGKTLGSERFPAGPIAVDSVPFFILTGTEDQRPRNELAGLADNARCRMEESFPPYHSPPGPPGRSEGTRASKTTGFCGGMGNDAGRDGRVSDDSEKAHRALGWLLPVLLSLLWARVSQVLCALNRGKGSKNSLIFQKLRTTILLGARRFRITGKTF